MNISSGVSLAIIGDSESLAVVPSSEGTFKYKKITARVKTNQPSGYSLILNNYNTSEYLGTPTGWVNGVYYDAKKIYSNFEGEVTSSSMPIDSWGISFDGEGYRSRSTLIGDAGGYTIKQTTNLSDTDQDIYLGVKVGNTTSYGHYTATISLTAYTESSWISDEENSMYGITTLQEMTSNVCYYTPTPDDDATGIIWEYDDEDTKKIPHTKLIDSRDGKEYVVARYADGSCWMVQNMDYNISDTYELTKYNTDIRSSSIPPLFTFTNPTSTTLSGFKESDMYEQDGYTLLAAPEKSYAPQGTERYYQGGTTAASTPTDSTDEYAWEKTGVYYNYAATALRDVDESYSHGSICPAGWELPSGDEIESLISAQNGSEQFSMSMTPFILSGKIVYDANTDETSIVDAGTAGYYWTRESEYDSNISRYADNVVKITTNEITYSMENANNYDGAQVRCKYYW